MEKFQKIKSFSEVVCFRRLLCYNSHKPKGKIGDNFYYFVK